jgi:hypothetical protein
VIEDGLLDEAWTAFAFEPKEHSYHWCGFIPG